MTRFLISFDDGAMTFPQSELPAVADAAHAVLREAKAAGVYIHGGGVANDWARTVGTDGTITDGPYPTAKAMLGGFVILNVASHDDALQWAAKFAAACRCAQEVRALMDDPEA